eukprot:306763_1
MANKNTHFYSSFMSNHNNSIIILLLISLIQHSISQTCCSCTTPMQTLCDDQQCSGYICTNYQELISCCLDSWEDQCAAKAQEICLPSTTIIPSVSPIYIHEGLCCSCTIERESSGCKKDQECEDIICDENTGDPICCNFEWDITCVESA